MTSFFWASLASSRAILSSWAESFLRLAAAGLLEGRLGVVKQNLLPGVDLVRLDAVLVAQVRDGNLVDQIPLENGCLLVGAKVSS